MATVYSMICFGGRSGKTVTISNASPAVVTLANHGLRDGTGVVYSTTGVLPAGMTAGTMYYSRSTSSSTYILYDTQAHAIAGGTTGRINTSSAGSGTHTVKGAFFSGLTVDQKARYGSPGSERIYDGLVSWRTARVAAASAYDTEICEIGEAWDDIAAAEFDMNIPCAQVYIRPEMDGVKTAAWHGGVYNSGYRFYINVSFGIGILFNGYRHSIEGINILSTANSCIITRFSGQFNTVKKCFIIGNGTGNSQTGCQSWASANDFLNNVIVNCASGISPATFSSNGNMHANNLVAKCTTGFVGGDGIAGFFYNNIAVGNTTDWGTPFTSINGAGFNYSPAGGQPWYKGTDTSIKTITTSNFVDYTNNDFHPALSTDPQVESGVTVASMTAEDIADAYRPNYINVTTDVWDGGPFEYDHGNGLPPSTVNVQLTGLVTGSRVKIKKTSDGTSLYNNTVSGTTLSFSQSVGGDTAVNIYVGKGSAAPYYHPLSTTATIDSSSGLDLSITQIADIAASSYAAGVGTDWSVNTSTGAITHASGTTRYNVRDLYSWILDTYDESSTIDLSIPMYGTTSTIFSLINSGAISDADLQYLKGGSVQKQDGTLWSNVYTDGTIAGAPDMYVVQNGSKVTPFWAAGHIDILVKVSNAGTLIDSGLVTVYARKYGYSYDYYQADLSNGGRNVAPIGVQVDANNQTSAATVATYTDITLTFGTISRDLGEGAGAATYKCEIDCNNRTLAEVYEYTKYLTRDVSTATLNSVPGWRYQAADAGYTPNKASPFGTFAGDRWFVAQGVWLKNVATSDTYNYQLTDDAGATHSLTPPNGAVTATLMANTRIVLYNTTQGVEIDNQMVAGTTYTYTITTEAVTNDVLTLFFFKEGYLEGSATLIWSGTTAAFVATYTADVVENALATELGITGSACTEFAADTTGHVYIELNDPDGVTMKARLALWYKYILTTATGSRYFRGGMTLLSTAAFRINSSVVNILLENVNSLTSVRFSDVQRRLYRDDGSTVIAPTSYSLHNDYSGVPDVVETGVSGLTGAESAQLMGLPSASATATAVWGSPARTLTQTEFLTNAESTQLMALPSAADNASQVWAAATRTLTQDVGLTADQDTMLTEIGKLQGLVPGVPLVVGPTSRTAGGITQTISESGGVVTVERA